MNSRKLLLLTNHPYSQSRFGIAFMNCHVRFFIIVFTPTLMVYVFNCMWVPVIP
uniref:Transmembrane protein n=1 Tax=Rhizophora mucronata TaxID=61149 RepID=A0A2P2PXC0_RHIMU